MSTVVLEMNIMTMLHIVLRLYWSLCWVSFIWTEFPLVPVNWTTVNVYPCIPWSINNVFSLCESFFGLHTPVQSMNTQDLTKLSHWKIFCKMKNQVILGISFISDCFFIITVDNPCSFNDIHLFGLDFVQYYLLACITWNSNQTGRHRTFWSGVKIDPSDQRHCTSVMTNVFRIDRFHNEFTQDY